jgi:formylglycine-generating enzyme
MLGCRSRGFTFAWYSVFLSVGACVTEAPEEGVNATPDTVHSNPDSGQELHGSGAEQDAGESPSSTGAPTERDTSTPELPLEPTSDCVHPEVLEDCRDGLCFVPSGCFIMGVPRGSWGAAANNDVEVQVSLSRGFLIGQTEVTIAQWEAEGLEPPTRDIPGQELGSCTDAACPIANINLFDVLEFANRYSLNRGLDACYELRDCTGKVGSGPQCNVEPTTGRLVDCEPTDPGFDCVGVHTTSETVYDCPGFRLPTEAEWEYAARAGTRTATWAGDLISEPVEFDCYEQSALLGIAWYCQNSEARAHPVASAASNPWGLYDMLGNVGERLAEVPSGLGYGDSPLVDPVGVYVQGRNLMPEIPTTGVAPNRSLTSERGGGLLVLGSRRDRGTSLRRRTSHGSQGARVSLGPYPAGIGVGSTRRRLELVGLAFPSRS